MPRFIQFNCRESKGVDLRQSEAVLRHAPDMILLEYPAQSIRPITVAPHYSKKVRDAVPWVESDIIMWKNIQKQLKHGSKPRVFAIDGPRELLARYSAYPANDKQPHKTRNILWWVYIFLRERIMAENFRSVMRRYPPGNDATVLVFLQKFHWLHVQFLLENPSTKQIWNYYFGRFPSLTAATLTAYIHENDPVLWKYWQRLKP